MSPQDFILWLVAFAVGVHSLVWRNPTAVALVLAYMVAQAGLPLEFYPYSDAVVITAIMMKTERSLSDRFVILAYPAAWIFYIVDVPGSWSQWWHLASIAIAQFAAVGLEPALPYIRRRYAEAANSPPDQGFMRVAFGGGGDG